MKQSKTQSKTKHQKEVCEVGKATKVKRGDAKEKEGMEKKKLEERWRKRG